MKSGGERLLIVPPKLGYGNRKSDGIPPNSTLKFGKYFACRPLSVSYENKQR